MLSRVRHICYVISVDNTYVVEEKRRTSSTKQALMAKKTILTSKHISIGIRKFFANHSFGVLCCTQTARKVKKVVLKQQKYE